MYIFLYNLCELNVEDPWQLISARYNNVCRKNFKR